MKEAIGTWHYPTIRMNHWGMTFYSEACGQNSNQVRLVFSCFALLFSKPKTKKRQQNYRRINLESGKDLEIILSNLRRKRKKIGVFIVHLTSVLLCHVCNPGSSPAFTTWRRELWCCVGLSFPLSPSASYRQTNKQPYLWEIEWTRTSLWHIQCQELKLRPHPWEPNTLLCHSSQPPLIIILNKDKTM